MVRFQVSIGQNEYRSDDGIAWARYLREVPPRHAPVVHGDVDVTQLPARSHQSYWDFVCLDASGFGVAVDHETIDSAEYLAGIFITRDGGQQWIKRDPNLRLSLFSRSFWPVERFASLALPSPRIIALAWEDPWLLDGSKSHVICSRDGGESWKYRCLGYTNPYLGFDYAGRLLALNDGYYMESFDGGDTWKKSHFEVVWPEGHNKKRVALIRCSVFTEPQVGYGLVVHWPFDSTEQPVSVGLVTTIDNGMRWKHLHVFDGPHARDINERHVLALHVE